MLCKPEDLSSDPQRPNKKPYVCNPQHWGLQKQVDPESLLASQGGRPAPTLIYPRNSWGLRDKRLSELRSREKTQDRLGGPGSLSTGPELYSKGLFITMPRGGTKDFPLASYSHLVPRPMVQSTSRTVLLGTASRKPSGLQQASRLLIQQETLS